MIDSYWFGGLVLFCMLAERNENDIYKISFKSMTGFKSKGCLFVSYYFNSTFQF